MEYIGSCEDFRNRESMISDVYLSEENIQSDMSKSVEMNMEDFVHIVCPQSRHVEEGCLYYYIPRKWKSISSASLFFIRNPKRGRYYFYKRD